MFGSLHVVLSNNRGAIGGTEWIMFVIDGLLFVMNIEKEW